MFPKTQKKKRFPVIKNVKEVKYIFFAFLYGAYDLAPDIPPDQVNCEIKIIFGKDTYTIKR